MTGAQRLDAADELTFLSFADTASREVGRRLPEIDRDATRLVLLLYRLTNAVIYDLESAIHRPRGWSFAGFRLLFTLWIAGPLESKRAAALSGMSRAAVSSLANTLSKRGLLIREPHGQDGRSVVLRLSPEGEQALSGAFVEHNKREQAWSEQLSDDDRATLVRLLSQLADAAEASWVRHRD